MKALLKILQEIYSIINSNNISSCIYEENTKILHYNISSVTKIRRKQIFFNLKRIQDWN